MNLVNKNTGLIQNGKQNSKTQDVIPDSNDHSLKMTLVHLMLVQLASSIFPPNTVTKYIIELYLHGEELLFL